MPGWADIKYRDFWDFPRIFLVEHEGRTFLFDNRFDEISEDYTDAYEVFELPALTIQEIEGDWRTLSTKATARLGTVKLDAVRFDPTRRHQVDVAVLEQLQTSDPGNTLTNGVAVSSSSSMKSAS
jgi:hypothetical protein